MLLSSATSATTRTAIAGVRGAVVSANSRRVHAISASRIAAAMSRKQGKDSDRGFTVEKCQETGTGLSEVVKTGG